MKNTRWVPDTRIFRTGDEIFYSGKWPVGSVGYESLGKGRNDNYAARSALPGLKPTLAYFKTVEEAKKKVETAAKYWLDHIALG
jgi:hypothetical protein